jgi:hypothetical protein
MSKKRTLFFFILDTQKIKYKNKGLIASSIYLRGIKHDFFYFKKNIAL